MMRFGSGFILFKLYHYPRERLAGSHPPTPTPRTGPRPRTGLGMDEGGDGHGTGADGTRGAMTPLGVLEYARPRNGWRGHRVGREGLEGERPKPPPISLCTLVCTLAYSNLVYERKTVLGISGRFGDMPRILGKKHTCRPGTTPRGRGLLKKWGAAARPTPSARVPWSCGDQRRNDDEA